MSSATRQLLLLALALLGAAALPSAQAQVIVYRIEFKHQDSFNVDYYTGGYLAAPLLGGAGSFLLTGIENGRRVLDTSPGSGAYFLARSESKRYNVVSATVGSGADSSANGSYVAYGEVDTTLNLATPTGSLKIRVCKTLRGESLAADDENGEIKFDGTVGTANFSELVLRLDEDLTREFNEDGLTLEQTTEILTRRLRWQGFFSADGDDDDDDDGEDSDGDDDPNVTTPAPQTTTSSAP